MALTAPQWQWRLDLEIQSKREEVRGTPEAGVWLRLYSLYMPVLPQLTITSTSSLSEITAVTATAFKVKVELY